MDGDKMNDNKVPLMLTDEQAAKLLNVSKRSLRNARTENANGSITVPFVKIGGAVRYRLSDIQKIIGGVPLDAVVEASVHEPGYKRHRGSRTRWLPFEEARKIVHDDKLQTLDEYRAKVNGDPRYALMPTSPSVTYGGSWVSAADWLGREPKYPTEIKPMPLDELKAVLREKGITTMKAYRKARAAGELPGAPHTPFTYYRDASVRVADLFGVAATKGRPRQEVRISFEEARQMVQVAGIDNMADYTEAVRIGLLPLPRNPATLYRGRGWVSVGHFFGREDQRGIHLNSRRGEPVEASDTANAA